MALLFIDGFDHFAGDPPALAQKYASTSFAFLGSANVRTGADALRLLDSTNYVITKTLPASGAAIVGHARYSTAFTNNAPLVQIREGTTVHFELSCDASRHLTVKRGATVLATGTTVLPLSSYTYLEVKVVIHDTTGSYEVRIDGVAEAALTTAGPVDTRNVGTTGQWDNVMISGSGGGTANIDDLYICDGSGAIRNTFLGPCKVETLMPQTDAVAAGSNAGLTPSTGTDHGALVDEMPANTTDYNSGATVGLKDTYQYPSLSLTGTVLGVQTNLYAAKSDAGARQVCAVVRAGGVDYDGANISPATSFTYYTEIRAQNPNTSADWTTSDITTLQAGMKVTV